MTLKELRYFIAVYQEQSIAKAAERLFVVPSVVSVAIKNLENEFHTELFSRTANRITSTVAGKHFYKRALDVMNSVSLLEHEMDTFNNTPPAKKKRCRIGISAALLFFFGEELDRALASAFPDYLFFIETYPSIDEPEFYKKYDITIALTYLGHSFKALNQKSSDFAMQLLHSFQSYIWISESSSLCVHEELCYELLKGYNLVFYNGFINVSCLSDFFLTEDQIWEVALKNQLITSLENFPCYTSDFPLNHGKLLFQDWFADHPLKAIKLQELSSIELIYKRDHTEKFISLITSICNTLMFSE